MSYTCDEYHHHSLAFVMVTTYMCTCTGVSKSLWYSIVSVHKENLVLCGQSGFACGQPFLVQGVYCLQYKRPAMPLAMVTYAMYLYNVLNSLAGSQLHVAYVIAIATWTLEYIATCMHLFLPADMSLAARTNHNTHGSYNFSVSSCKYKCLLLSGALRSNKLIQEKYCALPHFANVTIATHNQTLHSSPE